LYRGKAIDLSVYSRAELLGSDHKPGEFESTSTSPLCLILSMQVFSIFRADVRIIDTIKRAALSHVLLESVLSSPPGENLDEKLASLQFPTNFVDRAFMDSSHSCVTDASSVPPPSSEESAWWDGPGEYSSEIVAAPYGPYVSGRPSKWRISH
jgi:hypothetical protein